MIPDYQSPVAEIPIPPRVRLLRTIILLMGWGWVVASQLAGISGDRVTIPLPKKIALTLSACIIAGLLLWADRNRGAGCIVAFFFYAFGMVAVMWFWN